MEAHDRNLKTIFEASRQYIVPLYQRPYVWELDTQWQPLWQDVSRTADRRIALGAKPQHHFLGAIVLNQLDVATGEIEARLVIDGQQRLTTLQLLLAAARDYCAERGHEKLQLAFRILTDNHDPLNESKLAVFKVVPTNRDRPLYRMVMSAGSRQETVKMLSVAKIKPGLARRIADAYLYFHEQIGKWASGGAEEGAVNEKDRLRALFDTVQMDLHLVAIDLSRDDDPQVIFETLNARGTPLLPSDLVKNYLLLRAKNESTDGPSFIDQVYEDHWKAFDDEGSFWQEKVKQGRLMRPRIELFLRHFTSMSLKSEVQVEWLFSSYREYAEKPPVEPAVNLLADLSRFAKVYRSFSNRPADQRDGQFFKRLWAMELSTAYPLLLALVERLEANDKRDQLLQVMTDLESYLVRRMVCGLTTKNYNRFFVDMLGRLGDVDDDGIPALFRAEMLKGTGDSVVWPSDEDFHHSWLHKEIYRTLSQSRVRMILSAIERSYWTAKSDPVVLPENLTIEHILPRKWKASDWPVFVDSEDAPTGMDPVEWAVLQTPKFTANRNSLLHTFGNLTLLTKSLNPSVSNGSWADKRTAFKRDCAYALTRQVVDLETWDETTISKRGEAMFPAALKLWPRPAPVVAD